jgi:hypothetical protein
MCICYAQMMSAMLMFVLIALLVCAFIDEAEILKSQCPRLVLQDRKAGALNFQNFWQEQFLKTHYYTASKRLFMASMMYGAPAIGLFLRRLWCMPRRQ